MSDFDNFVIADGRHFKLFSDLQENIITQQEFDEQEDKLLNILVDEFYASKCKKHACCRN